MQYGGFSLATVHAVDENNDTLPGTPPYATNKCVFIHTYKIMSLYSHGITSNNG